MGAVVFLFTTVLVRSALCVGSEEGSGRIYHVILHSSVRFAVGSWMVKWRVPILSLENWLAEKFWIWSVCVRLMVLVRTVLASARNENAIGIFIFVVEVRFRLCEVVIEYGQIIQSYTLGWDINCRITQRQAFVCSIENWTRAYIFV